MEMITINKNLKKLLFIFLLIFSVFLLSCNKKTQEAKIKTETNVTEEYYLTYIVDKQEVSTIIVSVNEDIVLKEMPEKSEYIFHGWYIDKEYTTLFTNSKITENTALYGYYEQIKYQITFETNSEMELEDIYLPKGALIENLEEISKDGYYFVGWYTDERLHNQFDLETDTVSGDLKLFAKWKLIEPEYIDIKFESITDGIFANKDELYLEFYTYFYMFLVEHTDCDLEDVSLNDFLLQGKTWEIDGKSDMYHFGNRYCNYYLKGQEGGTLPEQDPDHFRQRLHQKDPFRRDCRRHDSGGIRAARRGRFRSERPR